MTNIHKKVTRQYNNTGDRKVAETRPRFPARPVMDKVDYTAFAKMVEGKFPVMMATLAK